MTKEKNYTSPECQPLDILISGVTLAVSLPGIVEDDSNVEFDN